ncbi:hypothetical protein Dimus_029294, partial [Dionaea muscipula]
SAVCAAVVLGVVAAWCRLSTRGGESRRLSTLLMLLMASIAGADTTEDWAASGVVNGCLPSFLAWAAAVRRSRETRLQLCEQGRGSRGSRAGLPRLVWVLRECAPSSMPPSVWAMPAAAADCLELFMDGGGCFSMDGR